MAEVGRVTIAGSRLNIEMGMLWHHLDRGVDVDRARRERGAEQCSRVRLLAQSRLVGQMKDRVLAAVEKAEAVRRRRNEIVHQDWLLRSRDAARPVAELARVEPDQLPTYLEEWRRESLSSPDWKRVPAKGTNIVAAQTLQELRDVERALAEVTEEVSGVTSAVASSRETGRPPGYLHPG